MRIILTIVLVCSSWYAQANELINSSAYGSTYFMPDERILFQDSAGRTVHITATPGLLKYQFQDGSYLELLQFQGVAKRYSKKTGILETLPLNGTAASPWDISIETETLFNNLNNHTKKTFEFTPTVSGGNCNYINGQYICSPPTIEPFSSVIPEVYKATSDNCAYERSRAEKPYLGYSTHGSCTRWATVAVVGGSLTLSFGCFGPQAATGACAGGLLAYTAATGMLYDRSNECSLAYSDIMHALQQCENNNPPGSGGGSPGGGGGGGNPAPDFGDYFIITNPGGGNCYREFTNSEGTYYILVPCP